MFTSPQYSYPDKLRKINYQGTDQGILWTPPGIRTWEANRPAGTATTSYFQRDGILLQAWEVFNSQAAATCGIGFRFGPSHWKIGRLSGDYATYTDLTANAQARTAITLQVAGADQTGFVILCDRPFGWVSMTITTAETNAGGATAVDHAVQYSNAAGTGWTSAGTVTEDDFTKTDTVWTNELKNFVWQPPSDWGKTTALGGLPAGWYALGFTSAQREANDVAAVATGVEVGVLRLVDALAQNTIYAAERAEWAEYAADGIVAYFDTANAANKVNFSCRAIG